MTPSKAFAAVALAVSTLLLATGCGDGRGVFGEIHTVSLEVTGSGGQASEVTYRLPAGNGTEQNVTLPWKKSSESEFVPVGVRAVPAPGSTVTCRILVDGAEVSSTTSTADAPAVCDKARLDS